VLLRLEQGSRQAVRVIGERLKSFDLDERGLQDVLFRSLDRLLPDQELLLVAQSRHWQEEPDLLALDSQGRLYIFEIKVWESRSENLLQALRYGQIFGTYGYAELDQLFRRFDDSGRSLADAHKAAFEVELAERAFNSKQVFVVLTNGLDFRTRQAVQYWRSTGLDVRPWVYRAYADRDRALLLELNRFAVDDDPYEDVQSGYYILNTNFGNSSQDHDDMLANGKAAAYFAPPKHKIERLNKGDTVYLYQSGVGIVAVGRASGTLERAPYHGDPAQADEEYFMRLQQFHRLEAPVTAAKVKELTGTNYRFMGTMFGIDRDSAETLNRHIQETESGARR